jgi:hypothetical protein
MLPEIFIDIPIIKVDILKIYRSQNIDIGSKIKSHDNSSSWKCNVPQRIELGWSDPFTVGKFFSTLKFHIVSYHQIRQNKE